MSQISSEWFKRTVAIALLFTLAAGCGGARPPAPGRGGAQPGTPPAPPQAPAFRVGMVTDQGGLNDESFNESAWAGLQRAQAELGYTVRAVESRRQEEYDPNFRLLAGLRFDLIWGVGILLGDPIREIAARLPSHRFGIIDNVVDAPNVASVMFREEEGAFLMGLIAARTTESHVVGFIGGMAVPVIEHFEAGYRAGIRAIDPDIDVITVYSGTFTDPGRGSRDATAVMNRGADVIFHAAGNTGVGVIDAVRAHNRFAIGVDRDQSHLAPQHVLSSMLKRVDAAIYDISKATRAGNFPGGRTTMLGLRENGVGYSPTTLWERMPPGTRELVDRWAEAVRTGRVTVPKTMAQLRTWTVPRL